MGTLGYHSNQRYYPTRIKNTTYIEANVISMYDKFQLHAPQARFFLFSGSRESLPYFSENPNKNKSAFNEFYFYSPLRLHYSVKNEIK